MVSEALDMKDVFQEIVKLRSEGKKAALATIIRTKGSAPRKEGAKMLVSDDGTILGSVGGGALEVEICKEAKNVMSEGKLKMLHLDLTNDEASDEGMICGGTADVLIEPILPELTLYVFGGGHISFSIVKIGKLIGFRVVVIDDRPEFANYERFPETDEIFAEDFEKVFSKLKIDERSYIVIVTRGHILDTIVLEWAIKTQARYIGMIGSKKKNKAVFSELQNKGISKELLDTVHAPIGLNIGAKTPEEIAVSIIAEIIQEKEQNNTGTLKTWKV